MDSNLFLPLWIIFVLFYGVFWLFQHRLDKKDSFDAYLKKDLDGHGFSLVSSSFLENKTPLPQAGYRTWLVPGLRKPHTAGYKIYRTVVLKDRKGIHHEVMAAIEYDDGSLFRQFERVIWEPPLDQIDANNK
jgi:hypothetical protein